MNKLITTLTIGLALTACGDGLDGPETMGDAVLAVAEAFCEGTIACGFDTTQESCVEHNLEALCSTPNRRDCDAPLTDLQRDLFPFCIQALEEQTCDPYLTPRLLHGA